MKGEPTTPPHATEKNIRAKIINLEETIRDHLHNLGVGKDLLGHKKPKLQKKKNQKTIKWVSSQLSVLCIKS